MPHSWAVAEPKSVLLSPTGDSLMVEQQSGHPLTGLDFTVKALLNGRWDADVTEAMASSKSHLGSVGTHRNRGDFFWT